LVNQEHRTMERHRTLFRRTARRAAVLAFALFASLAVGAAPAQAGPIGTYSLPVWQNVHTDRCLADSFTGGLQTLACISHPTQNWQDATPDLPTYRFRNAHTDRCLADSFTGGLQTLACINNPTQNWDWVLFTNGTWLLQNAHTDRCLADSFAGGLQTLSCISDPTQRWS
jgi:hypothetical protein